MGGRDQRELGTKSQPFLLAVSVNPSVLVHSLGFAAAPGRAAEGGGGDGEVDAPHAQGPGCSRVWWDMKVCTSIVVCWGRSRTVPVAGWARAGVSRGQRQQEWAWEAGLALVLSRWLGGTSCAELSPAAVAKPRCSRDAAALPAMARARTRDEQNNSCFPGSPSRAEPASGGQGGRGGSWDEAGGPGSPLPAAATARSVTGNGNKPLVCRGGGRRSS